MQVLVLGGDGYLGWPTALHLSALGHEVAVNDNFARRGYDEEMGVESLVPISTLEERIATWAEISGRTIKAYVGDLCDGAFVHQMVSDFRPDTIVHFGEQRAAPYSMIDQAHAVYTQTNNVGVFGTVLNRMVIQAVLGHQLTVYGNGSQTRGLINIVDTVECIRIASETPADRGEFRVFNQMTESMSIKEIAETVANEYPGEATIEHVENPRVELEDHYYNVKHTALVDLGLKPVLLSTTLIDHLFEVVER